MLEDPLLFTKLLVRDVLARLLFIFQQGSNSMLMKILVFLNIPTTLLIAKIYAHLIVIKFKILLKPVIV